MHFPFTFAWVTPLVRRGLRTTLTQEDAAAAMAWAAPRTEALLAFYDGCEGTYRQRMWRLVRGRLATSALLYAAYCGTQLAQPLLLRGAVRAVQDADPDGWAYALAIGANVVLASLCKEQQLWTQMRLGAELRALSVALVYRRAMALRESAVPRGLSNLFGNDCQKLLDVMPLLHLVWAAPRSSRARRRSSCGLPAGRPSPASCFSRSRCRSTCASCARRRRRARRRCRSRTSASRARARWSRACARSS